MNDDYDRHEYDREERVSDLHRVYVCWSVDGERELFISRSCLYSHVIFYFRPGLFEVAANSTRRVTWSDDIAHSCIVSSRYSVWPETVINS